MQAKWAVQITVPLSAQSLRQESIQHRCLAVLVVFQQNHEDSPTDTHDSTSQLTPTEGSSLLSMPASALRAVEIAMHDLSPEMALRIEMALGPKAEVMMAIQTDYAMARARARLSEITATVRRIVTSSS